MVGNEWERKLLIIGRTIDTEKSFSKFVKILNFTFHNDIFVSVRIRRARNKKNDGRYSSGEEERGGEIPNALHFVGITYLN